MAIEAIFGRTFQVLDKSMALRMMRQGLVASNIANADTPRFRALDVDFQATMANALEALDESQRDKMDLFRGDARHFSLDGASQVESRARREIVFAPADESFVGNDSNSVGLETELGKLKENALLYAAMSQILGRKFGSLARVIESSSKV